MLVESYDKIKLHIAESAEVGSRETAHVPPSLCLPQGRIGAGQAQALAQALSTGGAM